MYNPRMNPLYTRHFALDEFSAQEQVMLSDSRVLIVGCGGLGHLVGTYLTTAGVGNLFLNDFECFLRIVVQLLV